MHKSYYPAIISKTIHHAHPTLQKPIEYVQKVEREFIHVERIQQTKFDSVMSIDAFTRNDPLRKKRVVTIMCYKCGQKGHYRKDFLIQLVQALC